MPDVDALDGALGQGHRDVAAKALLDCVEIGAAAGQPEAAIDRARNVFLVEHCGDEFADALVVALGLDTFSGDPTTHFAIDSGDFARMGKTIGELGLPTLTVLEGGYSVEFIGLNTVNFLKGLAD